MVGQFNGFDDHILVMEGAKAWQKERRSPQEAGIEETMSGLIDNGVFELAEEDQDKLCSNINLVAKANKNESRSSKADRHIKRMSENSSNQSSNNDCG